METHGLRRLGSRRLARTRHLCLERDYLIDSAGALLRRESVRHPGSVVVVPWDGQFVSLIDQYRHPTGRVVRELPAGKLDIAGEPPEATARRECIEEVGLDPGKLTRLVGVFSSPGYSDEYSHIYLAEDLTTVAVDPQGFEERNAEIVRLDLHQIAAGLAVGSFEDAKTIVGLSLLLEHLS